MSSLYQVVPYAMHARSWVARVGQRAFISLWSALEDLEEQIKNTERYHSDLDRKIGGRGRRTGASSQKTVIVATSNTAFRLMAQLDPNEPMLAEDIRGWRRLTSEEYYAHRINEMMIRKIKPWQFEDRWLPLLPLSESPPEPVMMGKLPRRR